MPRGWIACALTSVVLCVGVMFLDMRNELRNRVDVLETELSALRGGADVVRIDGSSLMANENRQSLVVGKYSRDKERIRF